MFDDRAAYVEARDANVAYLGESELRFYLYIDPLQVIRPLYERQRGAMDHRAISREYIRRVEDALGPVVADANLTVRAEPWGGTKTGGPIPDQQYAVQLLGFVMTAATTIVLLVDFADVVHRVIAKAKELTKNEVGISNGDAVILAAEAIFNNTGERDLTLAFETRMSRYLLAVDEMDSTSDGWLVGFRSQDRLYTAHVDWFGHVTLSGQDVGMSWTPKP